MPFLDAKALETDPDGLAFLRSVIDGVRAQRTLRWDAVVGVFAPAIEAVQIVPALPVPAERPYREEKKRLSSRHCPTGYRHLEARD